MPEARDRLSRNEDDAVAEAYHRRLMAVRSTGALPDDDDFERIISHTPFRRGATPLTGGGSGQRIGAALSARTTATGGVPGRGLFGTPMTAYRRGHRSQNTPPSGSRFRRGRGGRTGSRSTLPSWYPRTPLQDITHVVRAIERRRARLGDGEGQTMETPAPSRMFHQDSSPLDAQLEHTASLESKAKKPLGKFPLIITAIANENGGHSELLTPQKKLLNSIDIVEKVVMEELNRLKRTPTAKKAERLKKVRTLMSMR